jgi:hypothetical protein
MLHQSGSQPPRDPGGNLRLVRRSSTDSLAPKLYPDFKLQYLPASVYQSMIAYGYINPQYQLMPNFASNPWHNVIKDHPPIYKPYQHSPRYPNLWSGEHRFLCEVCKHQLRVTPGASYSNPPAVSNHCICRAVQPPYFTGNTRSFTMGHNFTAYWVNLSCEHIITRPMPLPYPTTIVVPPQFQQSYEYDEPRSAPRPIPPPGYWTRLFQTYIILSSAASAESHPRVKRQTFITPDNPHGTFSATPPPVEPVESSVNWAGVISSILTVAIMIWAFHRAFLYFLKAYNRRKLNNFTREMNELDEQRTINLAKIYDLDHGSHVDASPRLNRIHTVNNIFVHNSVEHPNTPWIHVTVGMEPFSGIEIRAIKDSGADMTTITLGLFNRIKGPEITERLQSPTQFMKMANNTSVLILYRARLHLTFIDPSTNARVSEPRLCSIVTGLTEDMYLGEDVLSSPIKICEDNKFLYLSKNPSILRTLKITPMADIVKVPIHRNSDLPEAAGGDSTEVDDTTTGSESTDDEGTAKDHRRKRMDRFYKGHPHKKRPRRDSDGNYPTSSSYRITNVKKRRAAPTVPDVAHSSGLARTGGACADQSETSGPYQQTPAAHERAGLYYSIVTGRMEPLPPPPLPLLAGLDDTSRC